MMENIIKYEFTDLCKNCINGDGCKTGNCQCFGVKCEDFEPYINDLKEY